MRLESDQLDAITEMIHTGVDRAIASLSDMIGQEITYCQPAIKFHPNDGLSQKVREESSVDICVTQEFSGGLLGRAILALPQKCGVELGKVLGEVDDPLDDLNTELVEVLEEVGNIVLNGVLGTLGNITDVALDYTVPHLAQGDEVLKVLNVPLSQSCESKSTIDEPSILLSDSRFNLSNSDINGSFILLFDIKSLQPHLQSMVVSTCS